MTKHQLARNGMGTTFESEAFLISLLRNAVPRMALKIATVPRSEITMWCKEPRIVVCGVDELSFVGAQRPPDQCRRSLTRSCT